MSVRAKFKVQSVTQSGDTATVQLFPVSSGSEENKQFYKWTPAGQIQLSSINPEASKQFVEGKEFYVDFTPAG